MLLINCFKNSNFLFTQCSLSLGVSLTIFFCSLYFSLLFCLLSLKQFFKTAPVLTLWDFSSLVSSAPNGRMANGVVCFCVDCSPTFIFIREMLTNSLRVIVNDSFKENFYRKREKKINVLTFYFYFFISYKSGVKTFLKWIVNHYLKGTC